MHSIHAELRSPSQQKKDKANLKIITLIFKNILDF